MMKGSENGEEINETSQLKKSNVEWKESEAILIIILLKYQNLNCILKKGNTFGYMEIVSEQYPNSILRERNIFCERNTIVIIKNG